MQILGEFEISPYQLGIIFNNYFILPREYKIIVENDAKLIRV
jgi:hypothetical protein